MINILASHLTPEFFEGIMLLCFGSAWPVSIFRLIRTKKTHGKSLGFLFLILFGYLSGIIFELIGANTSVIYLYYLNTMMVIFDILLVIKFRADEKKLDCSVTTDERLA